MRVRTNPACTTQTKHTVRDYDSTQQIAGPGQETFTAGAFSFGRPPDDPWLEICNRRPRVMHDGIGKRGPALAETDSGQEIRARVFPVGEQPIESKPEAAASAPGHALHAPATPRTPINSMFCCPRDGGSVPSAN